VHVEPHHDRDSLVVASSRAIHDAQQRRASRRPDARCKRRIALGRALCFLTEPIERATVLAQDGYDSLGSTLRDIEDILVQRLRQRAEHELSRRRVAVSNVDAIERQRVEVHVEPQSRVEPLNERHRPGMRVFDALKPEHTLCAKPQRAQKLWGHTDSTVFGAFSPIARRVEQPGGKPFPVSNVVTTSTDGTAKVWTVKGPFTWISGEKGPIEMPEPSLIKDTVLVSNRPSAVTCAAFDEDAARVVLGSRDGTVIVSSLVVATSPMILRASKSALTRVAFGPGGFLIAVDKDRRANVMSRNEEAGEPA
jgi:WD40 repeat protein